MPGRATAVVDGSPWFLLIVPFELSIYHFLKLHVSSYRGLKDNEILIPLSSVSIGLLPEGVKMAFQVKQLGLGRSKLLHVVGNVFKPYQDAILRGWDRNDAD